MGQYRYYYVSAFKKAKKASLALLYQREIHIPLAGLIDKDAELSRLQKELKKLTADCEKFSRKLSNENHINKAPAEVVEKERKRLAKAEATMNKLQEQASRTSFKNKLHGLKAYNQLKNNIFKTNLQ